MAWEKQISGYKYKLIGKEDIIPSDARYINPIYEIRMCGWISNLQPVKVLVGHAILEPIYKNVRTKKISNP